MSSELIGELGQVVGMGIDGGLVHSEVVVMGEEMVVSSGTVVYQEVVPGVITTYNGNELLHHHQTEVHSDEADDIHQSVHISTADDVTVIGQQEVVALPLEKLTTAENINKAIANRLSLEELGCHDNNTVVEEEVVHCEEDESMQTCISSDMQDQLDDGGKSYALTPDPGTATRRGGPGPTKRHSQRYRKAWEQLSDFRDWLGAHHNVYRANCKFCNKVLLADFTVIKAHATSRKHMILENKFMKERRRYLARSVESCLTTTDSGALTTVTVAEGNYKDDYDRKYLDAGRGTTTVGIGSTGAQVIDNTDSNYSTGIYLPQQRSITGPSQLVSKAVVMSPAPNWKATAIVNGHVTRLDLSDYVGRYLILIFYPQDFSKICASEINALSDRSFEFRSIQTEIVACSVDSHLAHLTWSKLSRADGGVSLPKIPLIADPTHAIAKAYGVLIPEKGHTLRAHFIIDKRGIIRHMSITDTLVGRGTDELYRLVKALQYVDELEEPVPADWSPPND